MIHNGTVIDNVLFNNYNVDNWIHNGKEVFSSYGYLPTLPKDYDGNQYKFGNCDNAIVLYNNDVYVFCCQKDGDGLFVSSCYVKYNGINWNGYSGMLPQHETRSGYSAVVYNDLIYIMYPIQNEMYVLDPNSNIVPASLIGCAHHLNFSQENLKDIFFRYFVWDNKLFCLFNNSLVVFNDETKEWEHQTQIETDFGYIENIEGICVIDNSLILIAKNNIIILENMSVEEYGIVFYISQHFNFYSDNVCLPLMCYNNKIYFEAGGEGISCLFKSENGWELYKDRKYRMEVSAYNSIQRKNAIVLINITDNSNINSYKMKEPNPNYTLKWNDINQEWMEI